MNYRTVVFALMIAALVLSGHGAGLVSAQATPSPTTVRTVDLPTGRPVSMSPDGTMVVSVDRGEQICVYLVESMTELSCASLADVRVPVRLASVAWSPDSTRIAFAQDGFLLFRDSDLWVLDVEAGQLTRVTDEASDESLFPGEAGTEFFLDTAPTWRPDGEAITFSRSLWIDGEPAGNVIAEVPAGGGDSVTLAMLDEGRVGVWWSPGAWAPDGSVLYYTVDPVPTEPLQGGIWAFDRATGATRQVASTDNPDLGALMLRAVSPSGDRLLAYYPRAIDPNTMDESVQRFVDPTTGEISDIPNPVPESAAYEGSWFSTFSPGGNSLLQPWGPPEAFDFWATDLTTGTSTEVASDLRFASPIEIELNPVWASNGLVGVPREARGFAFFRIEGIGLDQAAAPVEASPVASGDTGGVPVGGPVRSVETPEGRAVSMSPDGHYLAVAVLPQESLCVYEVATMAEVSCADLSVLNTGLRVEDVVWSPDSTRLAFSEQTFVTFKDGDLWVMDAASGTLTNLTDDGYDGAILFLQDDADDIEFFADVAPAWAPDSQAITFSRSLRGEGGVMANVVAQIPAGGGEVETLTAVGDAPGIFYYRAQWSPDGQRLYYSVAFPDRDNPDNGIWVYDKASGDAKLLAVSDDSEFGTLVLSQVSPAGDRLLAYHPAALASAGYINRSVLRFVDPVTGELSPVPDPAPESEIYEGTWIATFSPDGQYLLQAVGLNAGARDFWVTNLTTGEATQVASAIEEAVPIAYGLGPVWGSDGTVFVAWNVIGAHFFTIEGAGTGPIADAAEGTPVSEPVALAPGSTAITIGMTPVFAAPDASAAVVHILVPNRAVQILSAPVENGQGTWYPVLDPDTQIIGYVQASRLEWTT